MVSSGSFPLKDFKKLLTIAFAEDLGSGDITSKATVPKTSRSAAELIAKEKGVIAGLPIIPAIFRYINSRAQLKQCVREGQKVTKGAIIYRISAGTRSILKAERIMLNFLQRMSGIATSSRKLQELLHTSNTKILDTRKTLPGYRNLDKYAVRIGGAYNHRFGLYDQVLIKDNHIRACGSVVSAVEKARKAYGRKVTVEAEVSNFTQLRSLLTADIDWIMLDNMTVKQMKSAVSLVRKYSPNIKLEASGNMNIKKIRSLSRAGLDYISVGSLTHSPAALDISLKFL